MFHLLPLGLVSGSKEQTELSIKLRGMRPSSRGACGGPAGGQRGASGGHNILIVSFLLSAIIPHFIQSWERGLHHPEGMLVDGAGSSSSEGMLVDGAGSSSSEGMLVDGACPGVMAVEALGSHTLQRLSVRSDEGEWVLEAGVPPVCEDVLPWRRGECPPVQWTVAEHSTVVYVRVNEAADGHEQPAAL